MSRHRQDDWRAVAQEVTRYADCTRRQVGAVLVRDEQLVGWGANRAADTELSCTAGDCPRGKLSYEEMPAYQPYDNCIAKHAEIAALEMAGNKAERATLYVTAQPCDPCSQAIFDAGVRVVITTTHYVYDDVLKQTLPAAEARDR